MTDVRVIVVPAKTSEPLRVASVETDDPGSMAKLVGGDVDYLYLVAAGVVMVTNLPEAMTRLELPLRPNARATVLADQHLVPGDWIGGDAFIAGGLDPGGYLTNSPSLEFVERLLYSGATDWPTRRTLDPPEAPMPDLLAPFKLRIEDYDTPTGPDRDRLTLLVADMEVAQIVVPAAATVGQHTRNIRSLLAAAITGVPGVPDAEPGVEHSDEPLPSRASKLAH